MIFDILNNEVTPVFDHNEKYIVPDSFSPIPAKQAIKKLVSHFIIDTSPIF